MVAQELAFGYPGRQITDSVAPLLLNIQKGERDHERIGDQIRLKSIHIRATISLPDQLGITLANVTNRQNVVRFWVAIIKNPGVIATQLQRMFDNNDITWAAPFGWKRWDYRFETRLLCDKRIVVDTYHPLDRDWETSSAIE